MKIALSGAANTGKTTLAKEISAHFGYQLISEGFQVTKQQQEPHRLFNEIQKLMASKFEQENMSGEHFVSDRSPIDILMVILTNPNIRNVVESSKIEQLVERAKVHTRHYDYILIPEWGSFAYREPGTWQHGISKPRQNPWDNLRRHSTVIGLGIQYVGYDRLVFLPKNVMNSRSVPSWLQEKYSFRKVS